MQTGLFLRCSPEEALVAACLVTKSLSGQKPVLVVLARSCQHIVPHPCIAHVM